MSAKATPRLSVIIPTLNEIHTLPKLLDALSVQTRPPDEIIVADAGSNDGTADVARVRGVTVVVGRRAGPGAGRNDGARAAAGDVFMFLDADVLPGPEFLAGALEEFTQSGFDVASCPIEPLGDELSDRVITEAVNLYFQMVRPFSPHAAGFCILVRREIHAAIGGFDEAVKLAEDHDYARRGAKHGEFGMLTRVHIPVSMRRLEKEGVTRLAFKYIWCEMHALAGKPIYNTPFDYEFGAHMSPGSGPPSRPVIDIAQLREQWGRFENPIQRLSAAGLDQLDSLFRRDWVDSARERFRIVLDPPDWQILNRYLRRRLAVMKRTRRSWRAAFSKLQTGPLKNGRPRLEFKSLRSRFQPGKAKDDDEAKESG